MSTAVFPILMPRRTAGESNISFGIYKPNLTPFSLTFVHTVMQKPCHCTKM